jgi:hypothetical protein
MVKLAPGDFATDTARLAGWAGVEMPDLDSKGGSGEEPIYREFRWE